MRALLLVAALLALGGQDQTPTFRSGTRLVELTVTALDKKGLPVTDLRLEDFSIQDNGKSRPVTFLEYDGAPPVEVDPGQLPSGVVHQSRGIHARAGTQCRPSCWTS